MTALFGCEEAAAWRRAFDKYWDVVEARVKGGKPKLLQLDKWYQEELPALISSRSEKHLTQSELVKLMEWKLTRGKFRPKLQQLVASNGDDAVRECSRKAFGLLPDVQAAVAALSALKGVGPATASAVLAAGAPESAAFMSDEAMESVPGLKPIQYTAKHYALYLQKMAAQSAKLNKTDPQQGWTPHRVELCLWATATASKLQLPLLKDPNLEGSGSQQLTSDPDSETRRPAKKLKAS